MSHSRLPPATLALLGLMAPTLSSCFGFLYRCDTADWPTGTWMISDVVVPGADTGSPPDDLDVFQDAIVVVSETEVQVTLAGGDRDDPDLVLAVVDRW